VFIPLTVDEAYPPMPFVSSHSRVSGCVTDIMIKPTKRTQPAAVRVF